MYCKQFVFIQTIHFLYIIRILMSVEKNTVKFKEHGKEVLVLEKSAGGR